MIRFSALDDNQLLKTVEINYQKHGRTVLGCVYSTIADHLAYSKKSYKINCFNSLKFV